MIFSIAMGADYSFYVKIIETNALAFFKVIIFSIGSVRTLKIKHLGGSGGVKSVNMGLHNIWMDP